MSEEWLLLFSCLLYFTMKDESVRFFLCTSGWWVFLCPTKQSFDWMSFWYFGCFDFFDNLKVYKRWRSELVIFHLWSKLGSQLGYLHICYDSNILNVSLCCFQIFILSCHITFNKFFSQRESHKLFISSVNVNFSWAGLFINKFGCYFLVVCSILQWKMSQSDSFSARPDD